LLIFITYKGKNPDTDTFYAKLVVCYCVS